MLELYAQTHAMERERNDREMTHRREWEQSQALERMERAVSRARGMLRLAPAQ